MILLDEFEMTKILFFFLSLVISPIKKTFSEKPSGDIVFILYIAFIDFFNIKVFHYRVCGTHVFAWTFVPNSWTSSSAA